MEEQQSPTKDLMEHLVVAESIQNLELQNQLYKKIAEVAVTKLDAVYKEVLAYQELAVLGKLQRTMDQPEQRSAPANEYAAVVAAADSNGVFDDMNAEATKYAEFMLAHLEECGWAPTDIWEGQFSAPGCDRNVAYYIGNIDAGIVSGFESMYESEQITAIFMMGRMRCQDMYRKAQEAKGIRKKGQEAVNRVEADMRARDNNSYGGNNSRW
jgi:hypothetical protein